MRVARDRVDRNSDIRESIVVCMFAAEGYSHRGISRVAGNAGT